MVLCAECLIDLERKLVNAQRGRNLVSNPVVLNSSLCRGRITIRKVLGDRTNLARADRVQHCVTHVGIAYHGPTRKRPGGCWIIDLMRKHWPAKSIGSDLRAQYLAEITLHHLWRRNGCDLTGCNMGKAEKVQSEKKERLVSTNRSTDHATPFILMVRRHTFGELARSIQCGVLAVPPGGSVEAVCTGLGNVCNAHPVVPTLLGIEVRCQPKFLNVLGRQRREVSDRSEKSVRGINSVDRIADIVLIAAKGAGALNGRISKIGCLISARGNAAGTRLGVDARECRQEGKGGTRVAAHGQGKRCELLGR